MRLQEFINMEIETVSAHDTVETAWNLLTLNPIRYLLVTERDRIVGCVSKARLENRHPQEAVSRAMIPATATASPALTLRELARLMGRGGVRPVPVVEDGYPMGVVEWPDLMAALKARIKGIFAILTPGLHINEI